MSGTMQGAAKARETLLAKDPSYYKRIGAIGGRKGTTGGFHQNPELARKVGAVGGKNRTGIRKCHACLKYTHDNVNGFCAVCKKQDTPASRALLEIDAEGKPLSVTKKVNLVSSSSFTKKTRAGTKLSETSSVELSPLLGADELDEAKNWLMLPETKRSLVTVVKEAYWIWLGGRVIKKNKRDNAKAAERAELQAINDFGNRPSKGEHGKV